MIYENNLGHGGIPPDIILARLSCMINKLIDKLKKKRFFFLLMIWHDLSWNIIVGIFKFSFLYIIYVLYIDCDLQYKLHCNCTTTVLSCINIL